ncbi:hypothetical protein Vretimale_2319 [Volvox reticuliferus]|uniref:Uncharacterized protein n=1 Tax=Volvox reticuliferus TaxID=1737510 RepID=A0A8J4G2U4_9CHLO|nr:hypothetical protein Vretifemale_4609 [Volvox reticuliferus]GIL96525.1 hypothetical protein Vretimale_2319 [Volvox reticuliferus]
MLIEALGSNSTLDELLEPLLASLRSGTTKVFSEGGGKERLLQLYQRSLAYKGPLSPPPQPASQRRRNKMVLLALLIPTAAVLLMAVAALWGFSHWSRVENARRAKTRGAPGVGPATTLLVTDIQDSTPLWEILPAEVMDSAVKLHQRVLRELLLKHAGYESATEGDSFILAFHRPDRALGFALAAQEALLAADWPQDLLASPHAAPLVVRRDAAAAAAVAASLVTPSPLREALSLDHAALSEMPLPASVAMSPLAPPRALRPQPPTSLAASPTPPDRRGSRRLLTQGSLELPTPTGPRALAAVGPSGIPPPLPLLPPPPLLPGNRIFGRLRSMSLDGRLSAPFTRMPATLEAVHSDGGSGGQVMIDYLQDLETPRFDGGGRIRPSLLAVAVRMARLTSGRKMPWSSQASLRQLYGALTEDGSGIPKGGATGSPHVRRNTFAGTLAAVAVATTSVGGRSDAYSLGGGTTTPGNTVAENGGDAVEVHRDGAAAAVRLVEAFAQVFPREDVYDTVGPSTGRVILFRGLRVRMGLECGIHSDAEVQYNRTSGRIAYPGPTLQLTKAIADFGQGGQITLSERAAKDVTSRLGGVAYGGGGRMASGSITPYVVLAIGTHVLKGAETAVELYGVYSKGLVARAGHIASPRTQGEKIPSVLSAPLGRVVVALAQVQDPDDFADWGLEVSVGGHREMLKEAGTLACLHGGYLVPTPPGSFQAVFCQPESAVRWILELQDDLGPVTTTAGEKGRKSPSGLLATGSSRAALRSSLLLSFQSPSSAGGSLDTGDVLNRLQRATAAARLSVLRVKGGVAAGDTLATLHVRGNMKYSGGAAKQAACLAANAVWHEVLASIEVACAVEGKDYPALAELRQQQMRLSNRSKRRYQLVMHPMLQLCPSIAQQQLQPSLQQRPGSGRLGPLPPGLAAAAAAAKLPTRALSEDDVVARIIFEQQQQQQQGQEQEQTHRRLPQQQVQVLLQQSRETATSGGSLAAEITREIDALRPSLLPGDVPSPPSVPPLRPRPPSVPLLAPVARPPVSNLSFRSSLLRTPQMSPLPQPSLPPRLLKCPPPPPQQQQQQQQQQQSQPGRPGGTRGLGTAAADAATRHLQWGTETRKVKYKGGSMLACWVRFGQDPVTLDVMPPPSPSLPQPPALPLPAVSPPPPPPS